MMKKLWNQFLRTFVPWNSPHCLVEGLYMLYSPMTRQDDGNFEGHQEFHQGVEHYEWVNLLTPNGGLVREIPVISVET